MRTCKHLKDQTVELITRTRKKPNVVKIHDTVKVGIDMVDPKVSRHTILDPQTQPSVILILSPWAKKYSFLTK